MFEAYEFTPIGALVLYKWELEEALKACRGSGVASVGLSRFRGRVSCEGGSLYVEWMGRVVEVDLGLVGVQRLRDRDVIVVHGSRVSKAEIHDGAFYKLVATGWGEPTLEINGIHMHRITGVSPLRDASRKVGAAGVRPGSRVLDVCTGLGYTVYWSLRRGASRVYTIEVDENVVLLARLNPWSWHLSDERVRLVLGDAVEVVEYFADGYFDSIIHDPPRLSEATGDLYSVDFYRGLYRVLRRGGALFHYTGEPGRVRGASITAGVARRLREAGFHVRRFSGELGGFVAVKT